MLRPIKLGDPMTVRGKVGAVVYLHRGGAVDVQLNNGNRYRVSGLWVDADGHPCRLEGK